MKSEPAHRRALCMAAILLSFLVFLGAAWLIGGISATPYETRDSQGRTMGFNDIFSDEHYHILLRNADWPHALRVVKEDDLCIQHLALIAAHAALLILLVRGRDRTVFWFLCAQPVIFFWGWFGFWMLPLEIIGLLLSRTNDGEAFTDIPYVAIMSQGAWFLACAWVACSLLLWKPGPRLI